MKTGIIKHTDGSDLTDDCGSPIKIIVAKDGCLAIQHKTLDGKSTQLILDKDVVDLLKSRLSK